MKVKCDHRSKFSNLSNWKEEAWKEKNQGFNGIRTRDLRDAGAMLYQLSYEATHFIAKHKLRFWKESQLTAFVMRRIDRSLMYTEEFCGSSFDKVT